jgi:ATP-dependent helicase/nuclease subunit A
MTPRRRNPLPDHEARERAARDFTTNLVVTAGAGTGKTSLLVERVLSATVGARVPLERIAAITFTEKAAADMRVRVAAALEKLWRLCEPGARLPEGEEEAPRAFRWLREGQGLPAAEIAAGARAALDALDRARIGTIHGFCADLLRRHPRAAGVDPDFTVDPGPALARRFEEVWQAFLARELGPSPPHAAAWKRTLARFQEPALRDLAWELARFRIPLDAIDLERMSERAGDMLARSEVETEGVVLDETAVRDAVALLLPFAREFQAAYLRAGHVSLDGLLLLTRNLLRDHPAVRRRVRGTLDALLVDEFQDTDPLQYEIVFFLAEEPEGEAPNAYTTRLARGRLFIVGDPKQSIYRFRNADMAAYARAVRHVKSGGGEELVLEASFRAPDRVLGPLNDLFGAILAPRSDADLAYEPRYAPIRSAVNAGAPAGAGVALWSVGRPGGERVRAPERRVDEGGTIARWIRAEVDASRLRYGKIALLFRALTEVERTLRGLQEAAIPYVLDGGGAFRQRPEVADLLAFLRAAANPNNPAALLAVLRSPVGGCSDEELVRLKAEGHALRLDRAARIPATRFPNVARTMALVRNYQEEAERLPVDQALRAALDLAPFRELHAAAYQGAQRVANLRKLVDQAAAVALREAISFEASLDVLEEEYEAEGRERDSPLADETVDAVRVFSIHRAKGLEFPVVILPDLARQEGGGAPRRQVARFVHLPGGESAFDALAVDLGDAVNAAHLLAGQEDRRHAQAEEKRVFYVACTRAKERLILVNGDPKPSARSAWLGHLAAWGYAPRGAFPAAGTLRSGVRHEPVEAPERLSIRGEGADVSALADAVRAFERARERAAGSTVRRLRAPSGIHEEAEAARAATEPEAVPDRRAGGRRGDLPRAIGKAVHAALERWDFRDRALLAREVARCAREPALEAAFDPGDVARGAMEALEGLLASELPARFRRAEILGREIPILLEEDGVIWRGWIDLLLRENGEVVVVDWKTDSDARFEETGPDHHGDQLRIYARAVQRALGLDRPPRCELAHVRTGRAIPVPPQGPPPSRGA